MNSILWSILLASAATSFTFPALAGRSNTDYTFIVDKLWYGCQHFGETYQEISTFETANFYVNLCQKGNNYFYSGTAKNRSVKSNFIPAYITDKLNTYQADNGNTSYIVKINSTEATLIIKRNGNTVIVESALLPNCPQVHYDPNIHIAQELAYSNYQAQLIGDHSILNSNQIYISEINLSNKLPKTDISEQQVFTLMPNQISSFSHCF